MSGEAYDFNRWRTLDSVDDILNNKEEILRCAKDLEVEGAKLEAYYLRRFVMNAEFIESQLNINRRQDRDKVIKDFVYWKSGDNPESCFRRHSRRFES